MNGTRKAGSPVRVAAGRLLAAVAVLGRLCLLAAAAPEGAEGVDALATCPRPEPVLPWQHRPPV
jgi:hypothetical protein